MTILLGWVAYTLFPAGALVALGIAAVGFSALADGSVAERAVLSLGLPGLPFHLRLDALSGCFLLLLGIVGAGISVFAAGYFRAGEGTAPGLLCLQYHTFLASMAMVILADDAYLFMVAWETMALSSYFLVTTQHRIPEIQRAGFLYLLMAHVGALALLLCFGVLHGGSWIMTFDAMRGATLSPAWAGLAFGLALFGFGAKAGLVPLHVVVVHEGHAPVAGAHPRERGLERGTRGVGAAVRGNQQAVGRDLHVGESGRLEPCRDLVSLRRRGRIAGDELRRRHRVLHHRQRRGPGGGDEAVQLGRVAQLQRHIDVHRLRRRQRPVDHVALAQHGSVLIERNERIAAADRTDRRGADRTRSGETDRRHQQFETIVTWHLQLPKFSEAKGRPESAHAS